MDPGHLNISRQFCQSINTLWVKQDKRTMDPGQLHLPQQFCQSIDTFWVKNVFGQKHIWINIFYNNNNNNVSRTTTLLMLTMRKSINRARIHCLGSVMQQVTMRQVMPKLVMLKLLTKGLVDLINYAISSLSTRYLRCLQ